MEHRNKIKYTKTAINTQLSTRKSEECKADLQIYDEQLKEISLKDIPKASLTYKGAFPYLVEALSELCTVEDNIFRYLSRFEQCYYFDSGRSAIKHLVAQMKHFNKVLLPEFICESVSNCFNEFSLTYYKLKEEDFSVDIDDLKRLSIDNHTIIFLMHYFGGIQKNSILTEMRSIANDKGAIIIEDTTHSIFSQAQTIGDYMVCSIRKWFPIPGGGVLYYNRNKCGIVKTSYPRSVDNSRGYGMILKDLFLTTGFDCNEKYRQVFTACEEHLDSQKDIYEISDFSRFIASCVSIGRLIERRKNNYEMLLNALKNGGVNPAIKIDKHDTPLVYPLRVKNRDSLRSFLMSKKVYCAVHWPFDDNHKPEYRAFAKKNADELISLPIDQRYDEAHIKYLVDTLNQFGGDLLY